MTTPFKTACVIVAGGSGTRLGASDPKQFLTLGGRPVVEWCVDHFGNHNAVNEVVVVVPKGWEYRTAQLLENVEISAHLKIVAGGERRQDSVMAGLEACHGMDFVAIHDGARPFPPADLEAAVELAGQHGGCVFALPVTDSIKLVTHDLVEKTVPRDGLWAAQTPQVFRRDKLIAALIACEHAAVSVTDDASAFEYMGWPVVVLPGSRLNIKITYPEDLTMAEAIITGRNRD